MKDEDPAVTVCFGVSIDSNDLGTFTSCEGLGVELVMETREEGGSNSFIWQLPTRMRFSNVKFSRPLGPDTEKVVTWLAGMTSGVTRKTAVITAKRGDGSTVARWNLADVVPVRWTGPNLNFDHPQVAIETIEIAHHGFLPA